LELHFPLYIFSIWEILSPYSLDMVPMFSGGGGDPYGNAENEVSMTCYTPWHCMMKLTPAQLHSNFLLFPV
jgi:hypothetical protein